MGLFKKRIHEEIRQRAEVKQAYSEARHQANLAIAKRKARERQEFKADLGKNIVAGISKGLSFRPRRRRTTYLRPSHVVSYAPPRRKRKRLAILKNICGQYTIGAIFSTFLIVIIFAALSPVLLSTIENTTGNLSDAGYGSAALILALVPLAMVIAIIWGIFTYARPYFAER